MVVQEVLLADKIVLCFGDEARTTRDWDIVTRARHSLQRIPAAWEVESVLGVPINLVRESLPFRLDKLREHQDRGWPVENLLITTEKSLCIDPRGKIYGLLGLVEDFGVGDLDIDYSNPCKKFIKALYDGIMVLESDTRILVAWNASVRSCNCPLKAIWTHKLLLANRIQDFSAKFPCVYHQRRFAPQRFSRVEFSL